MTDAEYADEASHCVETACNGNQLVNTPLYRGVLGP